MARKGRRWRKKPLSDVRGSAGESRRTSGKAAQYSLDSTAAANSATAIGRRPFSHDNKAARQNTAPSRLARAEM